MDVRTIATLAAMEAGGALLAVGALRHLWSSTPEAARHRAVSAPERRAPATTALHLAALVAIVAIGAAGRLAHLSQPMREDEAWTYTYYASRPLADGLSAYFLPNNHLLHTLLVHVSVGVFGGAPWAIRLPALLAGIVLIPATYWLTRTLANEQAGLIAAAGVAGSAPLTLYATNARGYTLTELLTLAILVLVWSLSIEWHSRRRWIALAVLTALGMWVVPTMLFPVGGALLWLGWIGPRVVGDDRRQLRGLLASSAVLTASLTLMFYAPAVARSGLRNVIANPFVVPEPLGALLRGIPTLLHNLWSDWSAGVPVWGGLVFFGGLAVAVGSRADGPQRARRTLVAMLGAALALIVLTRRTPETRMLLYLLPLLWMVASTGAQQLMARLPRADAIFTAATVLMAAGLTYHVVASRVVLTAPDTGVFSAAREVADVIRRERRPSDYLVVRTPSGPPLVYYAGRLGMSPDDLYGPRAAGGRLLVVVDEQAGQTLRSVLTARPDVTPDCLTPSRVLYRVPGAALHEVQQRPASAGGTVPAGLDGCPLFATR